MMKRFWILFFALIAALGPLSLASAQWSQGYRGTVNGTGKVVRKGDQDFDIRRVRLDLDKRGTVNLTVYGPRESVTFSGRWSNGNRDEPKVRFDRYENRSASIDGTIEFSHKDGKLERITVSGRGDRNDVSVNFRSSSTDNTDGDRDQNNGNDNIDRLNVRTSGNGSLQIATDKWQITAVQVNLQRGGTARITLALRGRRDETLTGRWTGRGENIGLSIDEGMDGRLSSVRGSLNRRVRTGGLDRMNLTGQSGRQTVNITFRAN